ncbi:MAG: EFR1 family ferrodoxin, partial [Atribacterota bacterium]
MCTVIYYFSGTGNSLVVARDIADKTNGKLISITSVMDKESVKTNADAIGIVFPVYHGDIPFIIRRFVTKMDNLDKKYIFGVCTYGDSPGLSIKYLDKIIKSHGGKLAAGFAVNMPYNYITPSFVLNGFFKSFVLREIAIEKQQTMFTNWKKKLESIYEFVNARKEGEFETSAEIIEHLVDFLNLKETLGKTVWLKIAGFDRKTNLPFQESLQLMDYGFKCDDKCNRCGICSKVCPVRNIKMVDGRPVWQHHCEQCFACLQWCPKEAIQFGSRTSHGK